MWSNTFEVGKRANLEWKTFLGIRSLRTRGADCATRPLVAQRASRAKRPTALFSRRPLCLLTSWETLRLRVSGEAAQPAVQDRFCFGALRLRRILSKSYKGGQQKLLLPSL